MALSEFQTSNRSGDATVWVDVDEVAAVEEVSTRFGERLVLTLREHGRQIWVNDTASNRVALGLVS